MLNEKLEAAYKLEAHDIAVIQAHQNGRLSTVKLGNYDWSEIINEGGLEWVLIYNDRLPFYLPKLKLWAGDCDMELLSKLNQGDALIAVTGPLLRPEIAFGRVDERITALVYNGNEEILYKSPGFGLKLYNIKHHLYKLSLPDYL